jgi:hypothetical protein
MILQLFFGSKQIFVREIRLHAFPHGKWRMLQLLMIDWEERLRVLFESESLKLVEFQKCIIAILSEDVIQNRFVSNELITPD